MDYDKLLDIMDEIESQCKCPECGSEFLTSCDYASLTFLCADCGAIVEFDEQKNIISKHEKKIKK